MITPLGDPNLVFERMTGTETLGHPFEFTVDMLHNKGDVPIADLVGKNVTVQMTMLDKDPRYWNGIVSRFALVGFLGEGTYRYRAELRPWLWLLTRTSNSRIFQYKTVRDVIEKMLRRARLQGRRHLRA